LHDDADPQILISMSEDIGERLLYHLSLTDMPAAITTAVIAKPSATSGPGMPPV